MNKYLKIFLGIIGLILLIALAMTVADKQESEITSFEECVEAGFPVLGSDPEQCETSDGRVFRKELDDDDDEIPQSVIEHIDSKSNLIVVDSPRPLSVVSSPLTVTGEARGNWYFEASFPVRIIDADGTVLGVHYATAQGEWMTENFVPFESTITFDAPQTETGTLILERSNPSGLPENDDELRIPIRFDNRNSTQERTIQLYYYDPSRDEDANGNIMCSEKGLVAVERDIPVTQTPIQDTIELLLRGELTSAEEARGITTEYPLDGFTLEGAALADGVLTLEFNDPNNATSGGSCRAGILWHQIRETAEQFDVVTEVRFQPEELFQP